MNREDAKALLPVIQAFADGKTVQFKLLDGSWKDSADPEFGLASDRYRVKPGPKTGWINVYGHYVHGPFLNTEEARHYANPDRIACIQITYTEGEGL